MPTLSMSTCMSKCEQSLRVTLSPFSWPKIRSGRLRLRPTRASTAQGLNSISTGSITYTCTREQLNVYIQVERIKHHHNSPKICWHHLHVSVVQWVSHVMGIDYADTNISDSCHQAFHCNHGNRCISGRPAEVSTSTGCLTQI